MTTSRDVDAYLAAAPAAARPMLAEIRRIILDAVPSATESVKYGMPSYQYGGRLFVHFAAATSHAAIYGLVHVDAAVPTELAAYLGHRSTLRFKYGQPLPAAALAATLREKAAGLATRVTRPATGRSPRRG